MELGRGGGQGQWITLKPSSLTLTLTLALTLALALALALAPTPTLKAGLELVSMMGRVGVTRTTNSNGFSWRVEFGPCATASSGADKCQLGDQYPIQGISTNLTGCSVDATLSTTEIIKGSGPDDCSLRDGGKVSEWGGGEGGLSHQVY